MKTHLLHPDRDFDTSRALPAHDAVLAQDLELATLMRALAGDDKVLHEIACKALLGGCDNDLGTILYRQDALRDCIANADAVRELYGLAVTALERKKETWFGLFMRSPTSVLRSSIAVLAIFVDMLRQLRTLAEAQAARFSSTAFTQLFETLRRECSEDYLARVEQHLDELKFRGGTLFHARLGPRGESVDYSLRVSDGARRGWLDRLFGPAPDGYTFRIHERDEAGLAALADIHARGIDAVANAVAQSADHVFAFFTNLRNELAFHVAALNLHEALVATGAPLCFPDPQATGTRRLHASGLRDASLVLNLGHAGVGNELDADGKNLIVITGANQGGKSSFLRALGLAQLMMQAGLFVTAQVFRAELCTDLFTHFKREEDATLEHGKFDEEAARMSEIADHVRRNALVLCNESFASTNEREGSEVARQVVRALLEGGVKVVFVTHLYDFAHALAAANERDRLFLRAERRDDGTRTFRLVPGEPLDTSYGEDLYRIVFDGGERP